MIIEAMKQALEALENHTEIKHPQQRHYRDSAIDALREAIEQPAQQGCMRCNTPKKCALYGCSPLTWPSEQPAQQEPVAYLVYAKGTRRYFTLTFDVEKVPEIYKGGEAVPLYTSPPASKPLTDEERKSIREWQRIEEELGPFFAPMMLYLYEAIEAKLKAKNT